MLNKLIIFLLALCFINTSVAYPTTYNITNDAYIESTFPNTVFEGTNTALLVGNWDAGVAYTYIDLGSVPDVQISLVMYEYDNIHSSNNETTIYTTSIFDENTIAWNNKSAPIDYINAFNTKLGWNYLNFSTTSRYIVLLSTTSVGYYSSERTTLKPYAINLTPVILGNIKFKDVNNITSNLPGANVYIDSTHNATTDGSGNFNIIVSSFGTYNVIINKSLAFNQLNTVATTGINNQYTLNYSKPFMSKPYLEGNYIKGVYSHNFKTMSPWENPSFVFGIYLLDGNSYYKQCVIDNANIFSCETIPNQNYAFHFLYGDIYNSNLATYHPTLTGSRNFSSDTFILSNETLAPSGVLSKNPNRELLVKDYFFTWLTVLLLIIGLIFILSIGEKRKKKQFYINK